MLQEAAHPDATAPNPPEDWTERHARVLQHLTNLAVEMAEVLQKRVMVQAQAGEDEAAQKSAATVTKIIRCARQTMALEARTRNHALDRADKDRAHQLADAERRRANRPRLIKLRVTELNELVDAVITAEAVAAEQAGDDTYAACRAIEESFETYRENLHERLKDPDEDLADVPIGAAVARICRDIGLTPDWTRWPGRAWAIEAAKAMGLPPPSLSWGDQSDTTDDEGALRQDGGSLTIIPTVTPP